MLKITEFRGEPHYCKSRYGLVKREGDMYIRFEWNGGYLEMKKDKYDKLSMKKKKLILSAAEK